MSNKYPRCIVGSETARRLKQGHPWVIADRYTAKWPKAERGSLIHLVTEEGRFVGTALCDPGARIVARNLSNKEIKLDQQWLARLFVRAQESRQWLDFGDSEVVRLINAEGDGLPGLTVDRYGQYLAVQYYTLAWEKHLKLVAEALQEVFSPQGIYAKYRPQETRKLAAGKQDQEQGLLLMGVPAPEGFSVKENGLHYQIDLVKDLHTGLFHDQRQNRLEFMRMAAGCTVLNLFAYTGAYSVAAAAGGAARVTSVDVAKRYLDWAQDNFRINDIDPSAHEFIVGDCFKVLDRLLNQGRLFDIVFMDPPSFSTTHKSRFTTVGGTAELVEKSLQLIPNGGLLISSSNLQKLSIADYIKELRKGAEASGRELQVLHVSGQADDFPWTAGFPEGNYLKYVVSVVQDIV